MADRKSFIVFCDRIKELELLSNEECGLLFKALIYYVSTGKEIETASLPLKLLFSVFKSQIDENSEKYQKKKEANAEYYRNRKNIKNNSANSEISENSASDTVTETVTVTGTDTVTVTETDIINNNKSSCNSECIETHSRSKKFVIPSLKQVKDYCEERNNRVNAERFYSYYQSNGWKVGKNPMKDWKAAVRNWESNGYKNDAAPESDPQLKAYENVIGKFLY